MGAILCGCNGLIDEVEDALLLESMPHVDIVYLVSVFIDVDLMKKLGIILRNVSDQRNTTEAFLPKLKVLVVCHFCYNPVKVKGIGLEQMCFSHSTLKFVDEVSFLDLFVLREIVKELDEFEINYLLENLLFALLF